MGEGCACGELNTAGEFIEARPHFGHMLGLPGDEGFERVEGESPVVLEGARECVSLRETFDAPEACVKVNVK